MERPYIEKLQEFGLSEKEAKVYMASLELGSATADQLSKQAGVNRSTTYVQIEQLMATGLMSTHEEGKKTLFSAEAPTHLSRIFRKQIETLEQQSDALEKFVPDLTRLYDSAGERPLVRYFQGKEGLITMRNEVLKAKDKDIYMAFSFDHLWELFADDMESLYEWSNQRVQKKIFSRVLYTKTGDPVDPVMPQELRRVEDKYFPFESDVYIYDNKIAMASLKGTVAGVIIESSALAKTLKSVFLLAWQAAEETKKK